MASELKLERSIERWRNMKPSEVVKGSPAQVVYALEDARKDILSLAAALTTPVAPVSPDATGKCGELVTVAWFQPSQRCCDNGWMEAMAWQEGEFSAPVVLRSQAVELLAEEVRRERDLAAKQLSEVVDRMSDDYLALKAELDQAVGVIEDRSSEYEALEAKLAATEKALEFYKSIVKDVCESQRGTKWGKAAECIFDAIERAVLGGKPS